LVSKAQARAIVDPGIVFSNSSGKRLLRIALLGNPSLFSAIMAGASRGGAVDKACIADSQGKTAMRSAR
jgi:hypothetical protein